MLITWKQLEVYGINTEKKNLNGNTTIADFPADNNKSSLFKFKKIAGRTENDSNKILKLEHH